MPLGFHPDRYVAFPGDNAVLLDVAGDRYHRLNGPVSAALIQILVDRAGCESSVVVLLKRHGLVLDSPESRPLRLAAAPEVKPISSEITRSNIWSGGAASAAATFTVRSRLRRLGLKQSLADAFRRASGVRLDDPAAALAVAHRFAVHRAWLPAPPACLPDSLALHAVLCQAGIAAQLCIGVRDRPFAAHCWVQAGPTLLNDLSETVAELTPILVL